MDRPCEVSLRRAVTSASEPVSRILSCAVIPLGAALPRTLISDLPGGFGIACSSLKKRRAMQLEQPCRIGPMRSASLAPGHALPSLFGLAPCGVYLAPAVTGRAVRSYRTISPLPLRRVSKLTQGRPSPEGEGLAMAVSFLWHWPSAGLETRIPDVIRHTALRSSDFPPPANPSLRPTRRQRPPGPPAIGSLAQWLREVVEFTGRRIRWSLSGKNSISSYLLFAGKNEA
jgi:hypothetical protein